MELPKLTINDITLRPATAIDVRRVYDLAMDPVVRGNSFATANISFSEHVQWYTKKMNNPNFVLLLAFHEDVFAGQVRFDIETDTATIGISIPAPFRGRGLGKVLLKLGIDALLNQHSEVKIINAFIRPENIPSIKLFEKFGFQFIEDVTQKGQPAKKYHLSTPTL